VTAARLHWLRKALRALPCKPLASACWEQFNEIARLFRTCGRRLSGGRRRIRGIAPLGTRRLPTDPDARARWDLVGRLSESRAAGQQGQDSDDGKDSTDFHCNAPSPIPFFSAAMPFGSFAMIELKDHITSSARRQPRPSSAVSFSAIPRQDGHRSHSSP
jgi:hypothetical protein